MPDRPAPLVPESGAVGTDWVLAKLDGEPVVLPEWGPGRRGKILARQSGSVVQFLAGCGFSVSTRQKPVVLRGASPVSRRCTSADLAILERLELLVSSGAEVHATADELTISNTSGSRAIFEREPQLPTLD